MCFLNEYTCKISCLNQDLNITAAMNRSIEGSGIAQACKVESCELVQHITEGSTTMQPMIPLFQFGPFNFIPLVILLACICSLGLIAFLHWRGYL